MLSVFLVNVSKQSVVVLSVVILNANSIMLLC
jgi:hypothetical protein